MNFYAFHIGDYAAHTAHLEPMEDLAYRRMLDLYYTRELPLPSEWEDVARLVRMKSHVDAVRAVLEEFFNLTPDGWQHGRCDSEIAEAQDRRSKAQASAAKRWHSERNANALPTHCEPNAPNPNPNPIDSRRGADAPPKMSADEIIFSYGVPLLVNASSTDKAARSFLGGLRKAHGDEAVVNALRDCLKAKPLQPLEWLAAALPPKGTAGKQSALEARNAATIARILGETNA